MNESYNRRKMPVLRKDGQQDHRHPYGKWVSEASEGMYLLRSQRHTIEVRMKED